MTASNDAVMIAVTTALADHRLQTDNGRDPDDLAARVRAALDSLTADGTPTAPRTGEITTAAELDALPIGSVVLSDPCWPSQKVDTWAGIAWSLVGDPRPRQHPPLPATILFRPDAPQPVRRCGLCALDEDHASWAHPDIPAIIEDAPQPATTDDWPSRANDASLAAAIELRAEAAGDLLMKCAMTTNHSMHRADVDKALDAVWQAGHDAALAARGDAAPRVSLTDLADAAAEFDRDESRYEIARSIVTALGWEVQP